MIERLDVCVKNEIHSLRIQAKKEINNEREIHGGLEMIDKKLDVPVNKEVSSKINVEKILKGSLDYIPSPSVNVQIMGGKVCWKYKGNIAEALSTNF